MPTTGKLPTFLIVGAPKCGTTSLAVALANHPQVFIPPVKEVGFFNRDEHWEQGLGWYARFFEPAGPARVCLGEATPYYMASEVACRRIREVLPHCKLIFLLRNPITRAYSHFWFRQRAGKERRTLAEAIQAGVAPQRYGSETAPGQRDDYLIHLGYYTEQIERYRAHFPPEQLLLLLFDDLVSHPGETLRRTQAFLGVPEVDLPLEQKNAAKEPVSTSYQAFIDRLVRGDTVAKRLVQRWLGRSALKRLKHGLFALNQRKAPKPVLDEADRRMLVEIYTKEVEALSVLMGRDLRFWLQNKT